MLELEGVPLGIENTEFLEDLSNDGNGRVNRVGDDQYEGFGSSGRDSSGKIFDNAGIDLMKMYISTG